MKLHFDPNQAYQLDAVSAIVDIFRGQPLQKGDFAVAMQQAEGQMQIDGDLVIGNQLLVAPETVCYNVQDIQERNGVEKSAVTGADAYLTDGSHFSVEMETGTGKTYVYLRTIHELHRTYGFKKFVIVVPSVPIKEGVMKNLQITKEHFGLLYGNPEMDFYVYDPKKRGLLRQFATTNALQILVINIDSFNKKEINKIYQQSDWGVPIRYLQGVKPIVIVDEPQNMETENGKEAIENLNPLCTLRYSATHKYHYNLVYKLDPVKAYDLGLVKKIEVDSVVTADSFNAAFVQLQSVTSKKMTVTAKLSLDIADATGIKRKAVTVRVGADLYDLSQNRDVYKNGYIVEEIDVSGQFILFSNGQQLSVGQSQGELTDDVQKFQIKKAIVNHLEKERKMAGLGIKVLTLFFIDRVANYRDYDGETVKQGKFALWFEEIYKDMLNRPQYKDVLHTNVAEVHNGYFSQDKKGSWKDTRGDTQADDDTYSLIMKEKEKLLSLSTPLRFIFSHSALREGWDNPNVFQICTLNETNSEMKKRQEIGRGLRLPVNQEGNRVFDENINVLTVVANESYDDFARKLQSEIEEDCGVQFTGRIKNKEERRKVTLRKGYQLDQNFKDLWERIQHKTRYRVRYSSEELIESAGSALAEVSIMPPRIRSVRVQLGMSEQGVETTLKSADEKLIQVEITAVPDILGGIQGKTKLSRDTIFKIIQRSGKLKDILKNPQQFMDSAAGIITATMKKLMVDGIKYEKVAGQAWEMRLFENEELEAYLSDLYTVQKPQKTLWDYLQVDSSVESAFARDLESRDDVQFFIKLPWWFKIETPIGGYNPDWAIVFENDKRVYFVAETKSTLDSNALRPSEDLKIQCGRKHFAEFPDVRFDKVTSVSDIMLY